MPQKPFYITTTLPYVNADPHIGFAMEIIRADVIARAKKLEGCEVFFNTGTDEHGVKIYQRAFGQGEDTQTFVDRYVEKFKALKGILGLSDDIHFVRTTDPTHIAAAQEFWKRCKDNGHIYKKPYKAKYCPACELERTDTEIENGRCFLHQTTDLIIIEEENYFFKFSAFQGKLLELYEKHPDFIIPDFRYNEIKAFVGRGLEDFSISRLASKMPWGIAVPDDADHVMYVWFDALVNYISTLGWPKNADAFKTFWQNGSPVQYCGKDNLRQQAAMWQAMLMAAGLPNSHQIIIDGFVTGEGGLKMSKSLGNTVDPLDIVKEYGTDALRYYCLRELSPFEDSPFSMDMFKDAYNAHLANGLGNLTSRVMKMASANLKPIKLPKLGMPTEFTAAIGRYDLKAAADIIWSKIGALDSLIQKEEPFKKVKDEETKKHALEVIEKLVIGLAEVAVMLEPILPESAKVIWNCIKENKVPEKPLFMRK